MMCARSVIDLASPFSKKNANVNTSINQYFEDIKKSSTSKRNKSQN